MKTLLSLALLCSFATAQAEVSIITTLPVYAVIAKEIGGEAVSVRSLVHENVDPHTFEPRPSDVVRLSRADLFIHSGLDLEVWRSALVNASGRADLRNGSSADLDLSRYVTLKEIPPPNTTRAKGDIHLEGNPHYWLSPKNGRALGKGIATRLQQIDPDRALSYSVQLRSFEDKITKLESHIEEFVQKHGTIQAVPYHNEWLYLFDSLQVSTPMFIEAFPGTPPSPSHMKKIRELFSTQKISACIIEQHYDPPEPTTTLCKEYAIPVIALDQQPRNSLRERGYADFIASLMTALDQHIEPKS